jgi:pyruvate formate lyase activating enzyme
MLLGGLQKSSLIDYPGKISCVLFVSGCNFDCPYCHNPDLVKCSSMSHSSLDLTAVYNFLEKRKRFLDGVVISGGEPTLQKGLMALCKMIKDMGYPVKLDTNGSRPQVITQLIDEGLVDYIAMDIKTDVLHYSPLTKNPIDPDDLFASIQIIMESALAYEFRTTCVKPLVNAQVIQKIVKNIEGAMLYALQRFNNTEILHPEFFPENGAGYEDDELLCLKAIAEPWVTECIIR